MNCREAQSQIFAERDGALDTHGRAALVEHTAHCADCRRVRDDLTAAIGSWRADVAKVRIPDVEREWHAVRRRIRGGVEAGGEAVARPRLPFLSWFAVPLTAAAAVAMALFIAPDSSDSPFAADRASAHVARADVVDVPGNKASTMVYVDDKSGWLFVWASDVGGNRG